MFSTSSEWALARSITDFQSVICLEPTDWKSVVQVSWFRFQPRPRPLG
jgi:hypothetical protein